MSSPFPSPPPVSAPELRHRLRTPLNHIIGYSEFLIEEYPSPSGKALLGRILLEANSILESVQHATAGVEAGLPAGILAELRHRLDRGTGHIRQIVGELQTAMPPEALEDLGRIASAARSLAEVLPAGRIEGFSVPSRPALSEGTDSLPEVRQERIGGPGRILIVDDDEMNREMLRRQLGRQGHEVTTAADGPTALAILRERRFDMMLLDLMMPGMNGFEVLEAVKADPALSGVAVILVSALDQMDSVIRSIEAGAEDYLFKPVNPTLLRARVVSTLERMRAEEMVRRQQRLESVGLLAAGIAHDFNNLLTGIIGYAQLLLQAVGTPAERDMVNAILGSGERAAELTRQLLAYSGRGMYQMQPVNLASLIRDSEGLIRASLPKSVRLLMRLESVPPIAADVNQIRQTVLSLTLNAGEATGPDGVGIVTIETGTEQVTSGAQFEIVSDELKPGLYVWFEVRDNGCGMDPATLSKLFEPFFTTKFLGRGLGLAAVAGIVRSHKGLLRVTSTPGQGSALRLFFPAAASHESGHPNQTDKSGPLIMVVDDEPEVRRIVRLTLEQAGRGVVLAESPDEALEAFRRLADRIEIVLLDWKIPAMDESRILNRLRQQRPDLKVIVSGGFAPSEAEGRFGNSVIGYLQKPYRMSELVALLEKASAETIL